MRAICVFGGVGGYMGAQCAVGDACACVCGEHHSVKLAEFTYPLGLHGKRQTWADVHA